MATRNIPALLKLPPPALFGIAFAVGMAINYTKPEPLHRSSTIAHLGLGLLALGVVIAVSAALTFLIRRTTLNPFGEPSTFVASGPFRFTRNPMYLSLVIVYLGGTLAVDSPWPLLILPLPLLAVIRFVIPNEEAQMAETFGQSYTDYCTRVRRWV